MENATNQIGKKWIAIIIGLIVLIIIALALGKFLSKKLPDRAEQNQQENQKLGEAVETVVVTRTDIANSQVPGGFPAGIPIEKSVTVTKNYTQKGSNGVSESVREYETTKTLAEVDKSFMDFFTKQGWAVTAHVDNSSSGLIMVAASKAGQNILVNISENTITKVRKVEVTASVNSIQ